MPGTRKLGKTTDQRKAMLRQQVTDLLDMGRMETTPAAAMRPRWLSSSSCKELPNTNRNAPTAFAAGAFSYFTQRYRL